MGTLRLHLVEPLVDVWAVYFTGPAPTDHELRTCAAAWLDAHVEEPLRQFLQHLLAPQVCTLELQWTTHLPPPEPELLMSASGDAAAVARVQQAERVLVVQVAGPLRPPLPSRWAAQAVGRAVAQRTGGELVDVHTFEIATAARLDAGFPGDGALRVGDFVRVPRMRSAAPGQLGTLGLHHAGLPDLALRGVPVDAEDAAQRLLLATAQALLEAVLDALPRPRPSASELLLPDTLEVTPRHLERALSRPRAPGHGRAAPVRLCFDEGDEETEAFLELLPPEGFDGGVAAWLALTAAVLPAAPAPTLTAAPTGREAMQRAHEQARQTLPHARARFRSGLAPGETLFVQRPFAGGSGPAEPLWVAVTRWHGSTVEGSLAAFARSLPGLTAGHAVSFAEAEVCDWMLVGAEGSREGAFTQAVLEAAAKRN